MRLLALALFSRVFLFGSVFALFVLLWVFVWFPGGLRQEVCWSGFLGLEWFFGISHGLLKLKTLSWVHPATTQLLHIMTGTDIAAAARNVCCVLGGCLIPYCLPASRFSLPKF